MQQRLRDVLVWVGGAALFIAVAVDALAMVGRQIRIPLIGSIEIVQAVVLFAAGAGLVIATLDGAHARVRLLLERMPDRWRQRSRRLHALATLLLVAALLAGSVWIAADLWNGHEESELLGIPYRPLRVVTALTFFMLLAIAGRGLVRRRPK